MPKVPYNKPAQNCKYQELDSMHLMRHRLLYQGGLPQQDRMINDKLWTLQHAIKYSYQGAKVKKWAHDEVCPALINPDKVKQNYDDKIISIEYQYGFHPGDVFEWISTNTFWLVTLQEMTELAYFRSEIRRCNYTINWLDQKTGENHMTHAAVRGPVETTINFIQKHKDSVDNPNFSLDILMPKTKETLEYFKRYSKFYLRGLDEGDTNICWRVEAVDSISMPGVLQIAAGEYFANEFEDDMDNGIAQGLLIRPPKPEEEPINFITGPGIIKPKMVVEYIYHGKDVEQWSWDEKLPIQVKIDGKHLKLVWTSTYRGKIILKCGDKEKEITVDSLF